MSDRIGRLMMSVALCCTSWAASYVDPAVINAWDLAPTLFAIQAWVSGVSATVQLLVIIGEAISSKRDGVQP